jgi:hypothetical protein
LKPTRIDAIKSVVHPLYPYSDQSIYIDREHFPQKNALTKLCEFSLFTSMIPRKPKGIANTILECYEKFNKSHHFCYINQLCSINHSSIFVIINEINNNSHHGYHNILLVTTNAKSFFQLDFNRNLMWLRITDIISTNPLTRL